MQDTECLTGMNESHTTDPSRVHGGNIGRAAKQLGIDEKKIIDFSSNVNPLGPSSAALRAARKSLSNVDRYPDPEMAALRRAIARYFGIKTGQVMCGNGSNELIHLIPRAFRPKRVLIPAPTFSEYGPAAEEAGAEPVLLPLKERDGFRVDPLEMAFALKGVDMAFLCNPNNPTGLVIPKSEMLEIVRYAVENGVRLVIDEAFMDFIEAESMVKEAVQSSRVICLRTFTLFFGMPGLRVGYAVSSEETIASLRACQEPWTINIPGERAAIAALQDWRYIKRTRRLMEKQRTKLLAALRLLPGLEPYLGSTNFIFMKAAKHDSSLLAEKLGLRGLLVRDCSSFPGLDNHFLRVSVRKGSDNKRLLRGLREILAG